MPLSNVLPRPVANPTTSYWLSQTEPELLNFCSSEQLPNHVDTIIVGSGITGALIARELLSRTNGKSPSILMLEARAMASGATGRNGGHIKPDCYKNYMKVKEAFGVEVAKHITSYELKNMKATVKFLKDGGFASDVDLVELRSVDVFMTEDSWNRAVQSYEEFKKAGGDVTEISLHQAAEARETFRTNTIFGAVSFPACSLWPHKIATGVVKQSIASGLQVFTNTRVEGVSRDPSIPNLWRLDTTRGEVTCKTLYHATNGYAASLLPELRRSIVPVKGHVAAIEAVEPFISRPLENTYGIQWSGDFDYLIQRPTDGKPLIYGGRDLAHRAGLPGVINDWDDSTMTVEIIDALKRFPFQYLKGWDVLPSIRTVWSGVMGFTADNFPFIGELPGLPGQYIAAGFNGHGMARIFLSARAVVQLAHGEKVDSRVPPVYYDIPNRMSVSTPEWERLLRQAEEVKIATDRLRRIRAVM